MASALPELTRDELQRYARQISLPELGEDGQRRLRAARVLLVGAGGLGSPVALYLAAAGVGTLGIVEPDRVDASNLQRQVLHGTGALGRKKVESAVARLRDLNPGVEVIPHDAWFSAANALDLVRAHDVVVDGTDSFAARYLVNDACVLAGKPNVHGSVYRFEGQATVLCAPGGPCYRCLYPEPPPPELVPSCAEGGVLGVVPGLVGLLQATEVLKLVAGFGTPLVGRLVLVDALGPEFRTVKIRPDARCPACGTRELREVREISFTCAAPAAGPAIPTLGPAELRARLARGDDLDLVDVREPHEWALGRIEGARLVPLSRFQEALATFDGGREVILYCAVGARSARAAGALLERGVRAWNLAGGIRAWEAEGGVTAA